jgi:hypothetical protein
METREEAIRDFIDKIQKESKLFKGCYDAKHGSYKFMLGIASVLERLAFEVSEDYCKEVIEEFYQNIEYSMVKERD